MVLHIAKGGGLKLDERLRRYAEKRKEWHKAHYTQIKVSVPQELAAVFKDACADNGESIASVLAAYMVTYADVTYKSAQDMSQKGDMDYSTRRKRRRALEGVLSILEGIRAAEETSRDNMPVNLQGSAQYERTDEIVTSLEDVINDLGGVYGD